MGGVKMVQVRIFDILKSKEIQDSINRFLNEEGGAIEVIDIKFNSYSFGEENQDCHSAMVIYRKK